jgi:alkanesulfonate monooxygenase SsuD/methylene tetrahydromethanopterin reductase-like flavin-dependent oxidoreductase (luciferase family)
VKIGLQIPDFTTPDGPPRLGADLATVARTADEGGFEFIALMDHFFQIRGVGPAEREMLEAYTTLGYLAACTSRVKLLTLVTGAVYRYPGVLAKTVTTLDVLSGGRAWLGIGAAWNEEESSRFRRSPSGSSGWRRPCRSACRCGAATRARTRAGTTSWTGC